MSSVSKEVGKTRKVHGRGKCWIMLLTHNAKRKFTNVWIWPVTKRFSANKL